MLIFCSVISLCDEAMPLAAKMLIAFAVIFALLGVLWFAMRSVEERLPMQLAW